MSLYIGKMRADLAKQKDLRSTWKFCISVVLGAAACVGAGTALGYYFPPQQAAPRYVFVIYTPTQPTPRLYH